jgi:hypothetical protein
MNMLIGLILGLVFFIATVSAYCLGLQHNKQLSNGIVPKLNLNPVKAITDTIERREQKKEEGKSESEFSEVMEYTKEAALEAIKKAR